MESIEELRKKLIYSQDVLDKAVEQAIAQERKFDANLKRFINSFTMSERGCWNWHSSLEKNGYGRFCVGTERYYAHRFSYEFFVGKIPEGLVVDHICKNRQCVNPNHPEVVTYQENNNRSPGWYFIAQRQRDKTSCPQGHVYNQANTYHDFRGHRYCRICARISKNRYQHRLKDSQAW